MTKNDETTTAPTKVDYLVSAPSNTLPKWCNKANFTIHDGKLVVISLAFSDGQETFLIERVAMDTNMLISLSNTFNNLVNDLENAQTPNK